MGQAGEVEQSHCRGCLCGSESKAHLKAACSDPSLILATKAGLQCSSVVAGMAGKRSGAWYG